MSCVVAPTRHYAAGSAAGPIVLPITVHETRIELTLATADLLPEQEDRERSDAVAALQRMLERLCGIEVP